MITLARYIGIKSYFEVSLHNRVGSVERVLGIDNAKEVISHAFAAQRFIIERASLFLRVHIYRDRDAVSRGLVVREA